MKPKKKALLCGFGLDGKDEHVRLTKGPNFVLIGGSEPTHQLMQEKTIKLNEKIKKRGKTLETISEKEFCEIGQEVGLNPLIPARRSGEKKKDEE
jgi:hypothetical protein